MPSKSHAAWCLDLRLTCGEQTFEKGQYYAHQQRVNKLQWDGQTAISGRVRGSTDSPYRTTCFIDSNDNGERRFSAGICSCPVGRNCKHVVALALTALERPDIHDILVRDCDPWQQWLAQLDQAQHPHNSSLKGKHHAAGDGQLLLVWQRQPQHYAIEASLYCAKPDANGQLGQVYPVFEAASQDNRNSLRLNLDAQTQLSQLLLAQAVDLASQRLNWSQHIAIERIQTLPTFVEVPPNGSAVSYLDKPKTLLWQWRKRSQAYQLTPVDGDEAPLWIIPCEPLHYLQPTAAGWCWGPLNSPHPCSLVAALAQAPLIPANQLAHYNHELLAQLPSDIPLPKNIQQQQLHSVKPTPHLHLTATGFDASQQFAELELNYQGQVVTVPPFGGQIKWQQETEHTVAQVTLSRERGAEESLGRQLLPLMPQLQREHGGRWQPPGNAVEQEQAWWQFVMHTLPRLQKLGWRISLSEPFRYRVIDADDWYADIDLEPDHSDWFAVELGFEVDGERINLIPLLCGDLDYWRQQASGEQERVRLTLPDGRVIALGRQRLQQLLQHLQQLFNGDIHQRRLKVGRHQSSHLATLALNEPTRVQTPCDWQLKDAQQTLQQLLQPPTVPTPSPIQGQLRPYQETGLGWMQSLQKGAFGGILADDMGLGKTLQTLSLLVSSQQTQQTQRPSLVVAPTSLISNWRQEAKRWAPSLKTIAYHGTQRQLLTAQIPSADLVITSYHLLVRDAEFWQQTPLHYLILDEAQAIKNPRTRWSQLVRSLDSQHRLCLTGTPLENHLGELWALFDFAEPGLLGNQTTFQRFYRRPIEQYQDVERAEHLRQRIRPFILRRSKEQVAKELPAKTEILLTSQLTSQQRDLYETVRASTEQQVRDVIAKQGFERSQISVLDALLKLRQVCCDPRLTKLSKIQQNPNPAEPHTTEHGSQHSGKLQQLMELLPELVQEGRRVLLFSQFTSMLSLIEQELKAEGIGYVKLTGRTRNRERPIEHFQSGTVPVFLISLKAGGAGLNLTAADTVIHYDPWWNPAVERQATDRAHRIGQNKPVFVYKMITEDTLEMRIQQMQQDKQLLADQLYDGDGSGWRLSQTELESLFEPLSQL